MAAIHTDYKDGTVQREMTAINYQEGSILRDIKEMWIKDAGILRQVFSSVVPLTLSLAPSPARGTCGPVFGSCTASVNVTATPSGGSGTYTYLWTYVSGDSFTIGLPTSATANFSKTSNTGTDPTFVGVYRCTVNDGTTSTSKDVTVNLTFISNA